MDCYETKRQLIDLCKLVLTGRVLDMGGGGEGVISRHSGDRVVAIDKRADELAETPDIGTKIIMDACQLAFLDGYFDQVTCFYTCMYMTKSEVPKALSEAYRVLKDGGTLWIWDAGIPPERKADVYVAQLLVKISQQESISTGYGCSWHKEQSLPEMIQLCGQAGFTVINSLESGESFSLCCRKNGD